MEIWELKRRDRFTVPDLLNVPVLTFDHYAMTKKVEDAAEPQPPA